MESEAKCQAAELELKGEGEDVLTWIHSEIEKYRAEILKAKRVHLVLHLAGNSRIVRLECLEY